MQTVNYGYIDENNKITAPVSMCSRFKGKGAWHTLTDEERKAYGWYPCIIENEIYNQNTEIRSEYPECELVDDVIYARYSITKKTDFVLSIELNQLKSEKLQQIQLKKNELRDAGFLVDGILFDSDLPARTAYNEIALKFMADPSFIKRDWKASTGVWVDMNFTLFQKLITQGEIHLESCFMWQANKEIAINAATTVDDVNAIEI